MNASRTLVAACGWLGLAGCVVLEPTNPQGVSIHEPVEFRGLTGSPGNAVWVEAAPTRTGAFTTWPAARTTSEAEADYTVPFDRATISLYPWSISSIIPEGRWASRTDEGGCLMYETFVRVRDRLGGYQTFDSAQGSSPSGAQCFTDCLEGNQPLESAFEGCVSRENGVIRLEAGTHAVGDFVVDSPAVDPLLSCAHAIEGTLTIIADPGEVIALPRLRTVGALDIRYRTQVLPEFDLRPACGREVHVDTGQVRLPALTTVDGDVALVQEAAGTPATLSGVAIEIGLDALRSIGGDLSLSFAQGGASPCGLTALAAFEGNLDMHLPVSADFAGGSLLTSLVRVGGTVTLEEGYSVIGLLATLEEAGNVTLHHTGYGGVSTGYLRQLTRAGDVRLSGALPDEVLPALATADSLTVQSSTLATLLRFGTMPPALVIGALSLVDNARLAALTGNRFVLNVGAPLTIRGNGATDAEVCAFVAGQRAFGWTGTADLGGLGCP